MFEHAYVAIRDIRAGQRTDPDAPDYHRGAGGPAVPWPVSIQARTGWVTIKHPSAPLATYRVNSIGGRGLFALFGPLSILETIAAGNNEVMPGCEFLRRARAARRRALDGDPSESGDALLILAVRAWRTWVVDDGVEVAVRRTLIAEGDVLPATPPTVGSPWGTITKLYRPALDCTLGEHPLPQRLEDQPDRL